MLAGLISLRFSVSMIFVPLLPKIIEEAEEKLGLKNSIKLNDKVSSIFNTFFALGCLIARILGGSLDQAFGFRTTCDIMAISAGVYAIIFFFLRVLPYILNKR